MFYLHKAMPTYTCRICFEESQSRNGFISPCRCSGSSKHVHRECLDRWRSQNPDGLNFRRCNTCHFEYQLINENQDPDLQAHRQAEYDEAVKVDIFALVVYAILAIVVISLILYWLDTISSFAIQDYTANNLRISSPWIVYPLVAIAFVVVILAITSFFVMEEEHLPQLSGLGYAPVTPGALIGIGVVLGASHGFYQVCRYLDASRRKHRQRIWLLEEAHIQQVRDFGEAGPPQA